MYNRKTGFMISTTLRTRLVDLKNPGQILRPEVVLVTDSLARAAQEAFQQCPSDKTIIGLSITEVPVFVPIDPYEKDESAKEEKKPKEEPKDGKV